MSIRGEGEEGKRNSSGKRDDEAKYGKIWNMKGDRGEMNSKYPTGTKTYVCVCRVCSPEHGVTNVSI